MMKKMVTMPAHLMADGVDPMLFQHFSAVARRIGVYATSDCADTVEFLVGRWRLEKLEGLDVKGRKAQDFVCGLSPRARKLQERADERARRLQHRGVKFSWIFNKEL
ncbi:Fatty acid desaturase, type 2 [Dillenia turbinata]|uniref:Fatty acid desaturase, type 2 n=1 Tax=Dillenia turbinata TaxID=194707 RepID=A0AAN8W4W8_9MAGN